MCLPAMGCCRPHWVWWITKNSEDFRDVGPGPGSRAGEYIEWHTIANQALSELNDITRVQQHPLRPKSIPIDGYL